VLNCWALRGLREKKAFKLPEDEACEQQSIRGMMIKQILVVSVQFQRGALRGSISYTDSQFLACSAPPLDSRRLAEIAPNQIDDIY